MKKYPLKQNQFYIDPFDLWCDRHPIIAGSIFGAIMLTLIFVGCLV
jgi:hypothetical protein